MTVSPSPKLPPPADARASAVAAGGRHRASIDRDCAADARASAVAAGGCNRAAIDRDCAADARASVVAAGCRHRAAIDRNVAADARASVVAAGGDQAAAVPTLAVDVQRTVFGKDDAPIGGQRRPVAEDQLHVAGDRDGGADGDVFSHDIDMVVPSSHAALYDGATR